ncbi:hypothetical protein [Dactylosporangium maewongense]|uniref:hypothetical protein n=1 Tax=Dactylosporangium maewongense TaxID=634393 RepID=UPI0031D0AD42
MVDALRDYATDWQEWLLVFLPRELQPRGETFDEKFTFLGHCLPSTPPAVTWSAPSSGVPVALISMGHRVQRADRHVPAVRRRVRRQDLARRHDPRPR